MCNAWEMDSKNINETQTEFLFIGRLFPELQYMFALLQHGQSFTYKNNVFLRHEPVMKQNKVDFVFAKT